MDAVRAFFENIKSSPKAEMLRAAEKRRRSVYEAAYRQAEDDFQHAEKEIAALEAEAMKVMLGEGTFSIELISKMMPKHRAKLEAAQIKMEELRQQMLDNSRAAKEDMREYERLMSWAGVFDKATNETKHMIICSLIDRVEVGAGYKITIHFKLTAEQYTGTAA